MALEKVSRRHGAWKALLHKYTAAVEGPRKAVRPVTLYEISDLTLLDEGDDDFEVGLKGGNDVEEEEEAQDGGEGGKRRRRKRRNMRRTKYGAIRTTTTAWRQFQLGISNVEVYPENSKVVEQVLQKLATDK